jgi:hypothetical protein
MMDAWHSHASLRPRQPRNPQRLSHGPKALTAPRLSHGPKSFPRPQVRLTPRWGSRYDGTPICGQSHDQDEARRIAANNRQICRSSCGGRGSSEQRKRVAEATLSRSRVKQCPTAASRRHGPPVCSLLVCCPKSNSAIIYQSELIYTDDLTPSFQLASGVRRLEALKTSVMRAKTATGTNSMARTAAGLPVIETFILWRQAIVDFEKAR